MYTEAVTKSKRVSGQAVDDVGAKGENAASSTAARPRRSRGRSLIGRSSWRQGAPDPAQMEKSDPTLIRNEKKNVYIR